MRIGSFAYSGSGGGDIDKYIINTQISTTLSNIYKIIIGQTLLLVNTALRGRTTTLLLAFKMKLS